MVSKWTPLIVGITLIGGILGISYIAKKTNILSTVSQGFSNIGSSLGTGIGSGLGNLIGSAFGNVGPALTSSFTGPSGSLNNATRQGAGLAPETGTCQYWPFTNIPLPWSNCAQSGNPASGNQAGNPSAPNAGQQPAPTPDNPAPTPSNPYTSGGGGYFGSVPPAYGQVQQPSTPSNSKMSAWDIAAQASNAPVTSSVRSINDLINQHYTFSPSTNSQPARSPSQISPSTTSGSVSVGRAGSISISQALSANLGR